MTTIAIYSHVVKYQRNNTIRIIIHVLQCAKLCTQTIFIRHV